MNQREAKKKALWLCARHLETAFQADWHFWEPLGVEFDHPDALRLEKKIEEVIDDLYRRSGIGAFGEKP